MINKRNIIAISVIFLISIFINLFTDVKIEFLTNSLTEFKNFKLNCGSVYEILIERVEYTEKTLRMNDVVCYNNAVLRVLNSLILLILFLLIPWFGFKYLKNKKKKEDITDLLSILKVRNKKKV